MKNLQEATERICDLKGSLAAIDALVTALLQQMPADSRSRLAQSFALTAEVARTMMLHAPVSDLTVAAFERDVSRMSSFIAATPPAPAQAIDR